MTEKNGTTVLPRMTETESTIQDTSLISKSEGRTPSAPTVGEEAKKRLENFDHKQSVVDTEKEANKEYLSEVQKCIDKNSDLIESCGEDGAFVVVILKKERHMQTVIRRYFFIRRTLPTPEYDQTVWRFNHKKRPDLEFIWSIPDKETCLAAVQDRENVPKEEIWVVETAARLFDGTLRNRAKEVYGIQEPEAQLLLGR